MRDECEEQKKAGHIKQIDKKDQAIRAESREIICADFRGSGLGNAAAVIKLKDSVIETVQMAAAKRQLWRNENAELLIETSDDDDDISSTFVRMIVACLIARSIDCTIGCMIGCTIDCTIDCCMIDSSSRSQCVRFAGKRSKVEPSPPSSARKRDVNKAVVDFIASNGRQESTGHVQEMKRQFDISREENSKMHADDVKLKREQMESEERVNTLRIEADKEVRLKEAEAKVAQSRMMEKQLALLDRLLQMTEAKLSS